MNFTNSLLHNIYMYVKYNLYAIIIYNYYNYVPQTDIRLILKNTLL